MTYNHVIEPFKHQLEHFETHKETKAWGLFWEQGTAKTKPIIDTAAWLYMQGKIDGLLVIAPSGVERNWNSDELPKHLPPEIALDTRIKVFLTRRKNTSTHHQQMQALMRHKGLSILLISYDAYNTAMGKNAVRDFLIKRKCLYVLDESHNIKAPGAKKTLSILKTAERGLYRRVLTGTPISVGPFDLYSQIKFLDPYFWKNKGIHTFQEYKNFFGKWVTRSEHKKLKGYDPGYDKFIDYQNTELLEKWVAGLSNRVLKEHVLDLPPKLYTKRYFELNDEQRKLYNTLRTEYLLEIGKTIITAELPIVRLLRLQQITCNYLPVGDEEPVHKISKENPRLQAMEAIKSETTQPAIVWARFKHDVDQLMDLLGKEAVRYDGSIDDDEAERSKLAFQNGDAKWFVGTAQKGGPGLTLTAAKTVVYYSNSFRLIDRLQSEDRAHRAGMDDNHVDYIDLIASDTVDMKIVENLRNKRDIASEIQGDDWREWI